MPIGVRLCRCQQGCKLPSYRARVAESVDATDLKSVGHKLCRFKSGPGHQIVQLVRPCQSFQTKGLTEECGTSRPSEVSARPRRDPHDATTSLIKYARGYRAQIYVSLVRRSATFRTQREAEAWASARETELRANAKKTPGEKHTLGEALRRYGEEVSPTHRGVRWEQFRIASFMRELPVDSPISDITTDILGVWRDARLRQVTAGSVLREISLLSAIFEAARREWRWIEVNPLKDVRRPRAPDHRDVTITRWQVKKMVRTMGYRKMGKVLTISQAVAVAFLVALRTGMRAGELCNLRWDDVKAGYCILRVTKTKPRNVPLTPKALRLIDRMRGFDDTQVFGLKSQTLAALFLRYRERAELEGFTFHDSRHTAATWIAARMGSSGVPAQQAVMDLCKMFGWSNMSQALTYSKSSIK